MRALSRTDWENFMWGSYGSRLGWMHQTNHIVVRNPTTLFRVLVRLFDVRFGIWGGSNMPYRAVMPVDIQSDTGAGDEIDLREWSTDERQRMILRLLEDQYAFFYGQEVAVLDCRVNEEELRRIIEKSGTSPTSDFEDALSKCLCRFLDEVGWMCLLESADNLFTVFVVAERNAGMMERVIDALRMENVPFARVVSEGGEPVGD